jgi:hypothetical protein
MKILNIKFLENPSSERRRDGHDKGDTWFSWVCENAWIVIHVLQKEGLLLPMWLQDKWD